MNGHRPFVRPLGVDDRGHTGQVHKLTPWVTVACRKIMPLWLLTNRAVGGLNYTASDIGICILFLGPVQILLQVRTSSLP